MALDISQMVDTVEGRNDAMAAIITTSLSDQQDFIDQIKTMAVSEIPSMDVTMHTALVNPIGVDVAPITRRITAPDNLDIDVSDIPAAPILTTLGDAPVLGIAIPDLVFPTRPDSTLPEMVGTVPVIDVITVPDKPTITLPDIPDIQAITIPDPPSLDIPMFVSALPDLAIDSPINSFAWASVDYSSPLLTKVKDNLLTDITTRGTGIDAAVEQQIFDRERERDLLALNDALDKFADACANRGWSLPDGVLTANTSSLYTEFFNKKLDKSRDIAKESHDLAQKQYQFATEKSVTMEMALIQHWDVMAEQSLKAAISSVELGVSVFNAQVALFNASLERYKSEAQVYQAKIQALLAQSEIYKTQLEGAKVNVEVQQLYVELYKERVQVALSLIDMYKTEMEAANIQANINKSKLDVFRTEVEVYAQQVGAKKAEYEMYKAAIEGEESKVKVYTAEIQGFLAQVESYKATSEVKIRQIQATIDTYKTELEVYKTKVEIQKTNSMIDIEKYKGDVSVYQADIEKYKADISVAESNARLAMQQQEVLVKNSEFIVSEKLQQARVNLEAVLSSNQFHGTTLSAGAQIYAARISAAIGAINSILHLEGTVLTNQ